MWELVSVEHENGLRLLNPVGQIDKRGQGGSFFINIPAFGEKIPYKTFNGRPCV